MEEYKKRNFDLTEINKMLKGKLKESTDKYNQLENKLGEKNKVIDDLRKENEEWKKRYYDLLNNLKPKEASDKKSKENECQKENEEEKEKEKIDDKEEPKEMKGTKEKKSDDEDEKEEIKIADDEKIEEEEKFNMKERKKADDNL